MEIMKPHLGRLTSLSIRMSYRSSIVYIGRFFDGAIMTQLTHLELLSQDTDVASPLHMSSTLQIPRIQEMRIDAETFINLVESNVCSSIRGQFFRLFLGRYRPAGPSNGASATRLIKAFHTLEAAPSKKRNGMDIDIEDVDFDPKDTAPRVKRLWGLSNIRLCDIGAQFIPMFCALRGYESTSIIRCEAASRCIIYGAELYLTDVASSCSLLRMLQDWRGVELALNNCSGFDDWLLGALAFGDKENAGLACQEMMHLIISGCPNFSASALKRMCEMRVSVNPLTSLVVINGPEIDGDLMRWFEGHIEHFNWNDGRNSI